MNRSSRSCSWRWCRTASLSGLTLPRLSEMDTLAERLGLYPPWQQFDHVLAPVSAKRGNVEPLNEAVRHHLHEQERDDLFKFF